MDPQEQTAPEHGWWEIARLFHEAAKIMMVMHRLRVGEFVAGNWFFLQSWWNEPDRLTGPVVFNHFPPESDIFNTCQVTFP